MAQFSMRRPLGLLGVLVPLLAIFTPAVPAADATGERGPMSHPPMRPLPVPANLPATRPVANGRILYVDPKTGVDTNDGSQAKPWRSLALALRQLKPGDVLSLRGGIYYENPALTRSGTPDAPITIASAPGELAIIDGGLREFADSPATAWEPLAGGVDGEFVSTRTYFSADDRRVPRQFLPASWEPMWGIEDQRPLALGHFFDSMIPLHGYRTLADLRATNEFWTGKGETDKTGIYCGPGLWFNRDTGRIHCRLAHTKLEGLGDHAYSGPTDPRKVPLVISVGFGDDVLRLTGVHDVRLQNLVFRGATGSPMISVYGSQNVDLDHLTIFGGFPGLLIDASKNVNVTNCAIRSLAAPWTSRAHMKYRGTATYAVVLRNDQPVNENIEIANCEVTDGHDALFLRYAKNLRFHHNFVDNFNDDGLECGPKLRWHTIQIYQNRIGRILSPLTQHEGDKDESPVDHDSGSGLSIYRNVFDMRGGTYRSPPPKPDPTGAYLAEEGHLAGDHGGPIWPVMRFYHNTFVRRTPVFRELYLFGLAAQGMRGTERDVFNNIFVQTERVPGVMFTGMKEAGNVREGGNILWGVRDGLTAKTDTWFAKFRASKLFQESQQRQPGGWTATDRVIDPQLVNVPTDPGKLDVPPLADLRLKPGSPAIDSGQPIPANWPDPLRAADEKQPDVGAIPAGVEPWGVGVDGRVPLFGGITNK